APAAAAAPGSSALSTAALDSARRLVDLLRSDREGIPGIERADVHYGPLVIALGDSVVGPVLVALGNLEVFGTIGGDAAVAGGDVIVHDGAHITGDVVAAFGSVRFSDTGTGVVGGEVRSLNGRVGVAPLVAAAPSPVAPRASTWHNVNLAFAWAIILTMIGIGTLVFGGRYLDGVVETLEAGFARSFWTGVAAQLAIAPVAILIVLALALTIIGLLLIPFAIVAYTLAVAGVVTLGFLAVARVTGDSLSGAAAKRLSARGAALRAVVLGTWCYLGVWLLAAAFTWQPWVFGVLRGVAVAITWVAVTAGIGAAVRSRGGVRRVAPRTAPAADLDWQTPTPITGVAAARRPRPVATSGSER
ncbi:MAG TPA: hypothetical protein VFG84_11575, partial [Gemmatimonadaceae bacterium]|nr:hypothetical protein [Gemmatimonadaceae bacterium]